MVVSKGENEKYFTRISKDGVEVFSDVSQDKGGSGKYFTPLNLIEAGYASCLNITTRMILDRMNIEYQNVKVNVKLNREGREKSVFIYKINIVPDIDDDVRKIVFDKVSRCPVRKVLSSEIEFQIEK